MHPGIVPNAETLEALPPSSLCAQPGIVPNAETFGAVLAAMGRGAAGAPPSEAAAAAEAALGVFHAMLAAPGGGTVDAGAYGALVRLQAAAGQWGRALAVHELMLAQARPPGGACYLPN